MTEENGKDERDPTRRVVLKRERVLVLPDTLDGDALDKTLKDVGKAIGLRAGRLQPVEAWTVTGEFEGASKLNAIQAHAGDPGTADAKPGTYRAPSVTAWKGTVVYEAPPEPLVTRRVLDDE